MEALPADGSEEYHGHARHGDSPISATSDTFAKKSASLHSQSDDLESPVGTQMMAIIPSPAALPLSRQATSVHTTTTLEPRYEIDWDDEGDPMNPRNWSLWYRGAVTALLSYSTWVVCVCPWGSSTTTRHYIAWESRLTWEIYGRGLRVFYSTSYASAMPGIMRDFHVESEPVATLGITTYLLGLAFGSIVLAPLSEIYGRRPVYIASMLIFMLLVVPCALASSLTQILVVRFLGAFAGSVMIANSPGSISDIVNEEHRALAFSLWSIAPMNGPTFGPLIGGFTSEYLGWRWTNWMELVFAGVALVSVSLVSETYAPAILRKKAMLRRKEAGEERWWCRYDQRLDFWPLLKVNLSRPFVMMATEPICIFWDVYIAVVYGILYLCFVAYPIVFSQIRGWTPGISGLAFVGICVGTFLTILLEPLLRRIINCHRPDPETGKPRPEAMISIVCIAAVLCPLGQLWFAWTCVPTSVHWIWPILAGVPFGAGNTMVFIYASNYLAHSYGIYAASALAGNSVARSILGGTLPLAGPAMYAKLNPHWAGTLLGLLEVALIPIPFGFYRYGHRIRRRSPLIRSLLKDQERLAGRRGRETSAAAAAAAAAPAAALETPEKMA